MEKQIMTEQILEECKEIMADYKECQKKLENIKNRITMARAFLLEAQNQLYYLDIQLQKMENTINE